MTLSELTLDREGLAAAIASEDAAFEAALREEAYRVKVGTVGHEVITQTCVFKMIMLYALHGRKK